MKCVQLSIVLFNVYNPVIKIKSSLLSAILMVIYLLVEAFASNLRRTPV